MAYKKPNTGLFRIPTSICDLNRLYESKSGNFNKFEHVFAIGNGESSRNSICGNGSNPEGGSDVSPVANIKTSSTETAASPSAKTFFFQLYHGNVVFQVITKKTYKPSQSRR